MVLLLLLVEHVAIEIGLVLPLDGPMGGLGGGEVTEAGEVKLNYLVWVACGGRW